MIPHKYRAVEFGKAVLKQIRIKNNTLGKVLNYTTKPSISGIRSYKTETEINKHNWYVLLPPTYSTWAFINLRLYQERNSSKVCFGISFWNYNNTPTNENCDEIINRISKFIFNSEFATSFETEVRFKPDTNWSDQIKKIECDDYEFFRFWKYKKWEYDTENLSNFEKSVESLCDIIIDVADFFRRLILAVEPVSGTLNKRIRQNDQGKLFLETDWSEFRLSNSTKELNNIIVENYIDETEVNNSINSKSIVRNTKSIEEKLEEYQKKLETGFSGEEFVFNSESELVSSRKLGYEVVWESQLNDSAGYDIQSWDEKGKKIFIEVKSTTTEGNTSFFMSKNELEVAHKMQDSYYIYMVYLGDDGPQILEKIKNPAKEANYYPLNYISDCMLSLEPVSFKVSKKI